MKEKDKIPGREAGHESRYSEAPQGYFENLESRILQRMENRPVQRKKFRISLWLPLAAAAVIIAAIFIFRPASVSENLSLQEELATVPEEQILAAILDERVDEQSLEESVNEEALSDSLLNLKNELIEEELGSDQDLELLMEEL